jgi:hypothetical protein
VAGCLRLLAVVGGQMPKKGGGVGDLGVTADGVFVPLGGGGGTAEQRPSRAARREAEKEEREREKREKRREGKRGGEDKKGGIRILPTIMMCIMFGPAVFPIMLTGYDFLASTSVGLAIYDGCIDVGLCTTYHDQLKAIYERENPKKVKSVGKLLKKWKGKEAQLIKEVEGKYEQRRRYESIRKAAMERDKAERAGTSEEDRGQRSKKKSKASNSHAPAPPKAKASGWDDEPTDAPPEEMWCVKLGLAAPLLSLPMCCKCFQAYITARAGTMRTKTCLISWQR